MLLSLGLLYLGFPEHFTISGERGLTDDIS